MMIQVGANHQYSMQVSVWEGPGLKLCNILSAVQVAFLVFNHLLDLIPFFLLVE